MDKTKNTQTRNATKANQEAAIEYAKKIFDEIENLKDVLGDNPSHKEIARTLTTKGIKTRHGKTTWQTTTVTRLMRYKKYYNPEESDTTDISRFFS